MNTKAKLHEALEVHRDSDLNFNWCSSISNDLQNELQRIVDSHTVGDLVAEENLEVSFEARIDVDSEEWAIESRLMVACEIAVERRLKEKGYREGALESVSLFL